MIYRSTSSGMSMKKTANLLFTEVDGIVPVKGVLEDENEENTKQHKIISKFYVALKKLHLKYMFASKVDLFVDAF